MPQNELALKSEEAEPEAEEETLSDDDSRRLAAFWLNQIEEITDDRDYKRWLKRARSIERRYRDERTRANEEDTNKRYSSLWANVETLLPALYGRCPTPVAERRFRDKDPTGRGAAQILERGLRNEIEICGFDDAMQQAVKDYLLPGLGTIWVRYEPEFEEGPSIPPDSEMDLRDNAGEIDEEYDTDSELKLNSTGTRIKRESTPVDYIQYSDFFTFPRRARTWREVVAVGKRVYMTRDQMKRRFGDEIGKAIPLQADDRDARRQQGGASSSRSLADDKAEVYEIWSKNDEKVFWVAKGYDTLCDSCEDPYKVDGFFPCARPLYANATNNTLIPVPDYIQYQDQAIQIDELTNRISLLSKACKVAGVYNAAAKSIQRLLTEAVENELIPVDDWAAFAEKGGVAGNISLLPLKEIIGVINELTAIKQKCIEEMDRLTGINDIMRGTSDARETLGGVRLKANNTGTRLQRRQNEVARFARDTLRIMADIMCQHFSPQSLIEVSGALYQEGLGAVDMPNLTSLQNSPSAAGFPLPSQPQLTGPGGAPQGGAPGPSFSPQQPPMGQPPSPMGQPPMPMGQPPAPQMPGMPPAMPMAPQQPQMPPEMLAKLRGLSRIATSIELLRNERTRGFRVDIEVDSTIYGDQQQEKGDRTQFIAAVTQFLTQAIQISAAMPEATQLLGKFLQFGVRGYRVGRDLETSIEDFCDEAAVAAQKRAQAAASQPNPDQIKAEADMMKAKAGIEQQQIKNQGEQIKAHAEVTRQQLEAQSEAANSQYDIQSKQFDMRMREMEMQMEKMRLAVEMAKIGHAANTQDHEVDMTEKTQKHESEMAKREQAIEKKRATHEETMLEKQLKKPNPTQEGAGGL